MSKLKNYTSKISYLKSIGLIEQQLIEMGANRIIKEYDENKKVSSISFIYRLNDNDVPFLLPANVEKTYICLSNLRKTLTPTQKIQLQLQAERTAWKNIYDWVRVQAVLIELSQVEFMQLFLPFVYDYSKQETFYDKIKSDNYKMLN